jgi:hypothetical protein
MRVSAWWYSADVDQGVWRKWTDHDVWIGRRLRIRIDGIGNLSSLVNKIATCGYSSAEESADVSI